MTQASVLGCRVDIVDPDEAVERIRAMAHAERPSLIVTLGTEMVVRAQHDARFRAVVNASALALCDTVGVVVAARLRGARLTRRIAGIDLIEPLCRALARDGLPIFLLGSKGDTAQRAGAELCRRIPALRIAGTRDGYFTAAEDAAVAAAIARSGARICFAGLGSPRQEFWLADHLRETSCAVGIGIGGSLDVLAGNVRRAPTMWRRLHAEWLYRLVREPQRWRRQLALPRFVWLVLRERAQGSIFGRA